MKPVIAGLVLLNDHRITVPGIVSGHVLCDAIELCVRVSKELRVAAEHVKQGPVMKTFVGIVKPVDTRKVRICRPQ